MVIRAATTVKRDTAGGVKQANTGSLEWTQKYDELGNVTEAIAPGRPAARWDVDSRGAVQEEPLPDRCTLRACPRAGRRKSGDAGYDDPLETTTTNN